MERPTYRELTARWKHLRSTHDARVREVACVGAARTLLCVDIGEPHLPAIALSAGVHGDEPAGPLALLDAVTHRELDTRFAYRIWPCTNPTGFDAGTRESVDGIDINRAFGRGGSSPESKAIVTANRDRKFVASVDLHEDDEASGFYLYEYGELACAQYVLDELRRDGVALDPRGALHPDPAAEAAQIGGLSLTLLFIRGAARGALTFETASNARLDERVAVQVKALRTALREMGTHGTARST